MVTRRSVESRETVADWFQDREPKGVALAVAGVSDYTLRCGVEQAGSSSGS